MSSSQLSLEPKRTYYFARRGRIIEEQPSRHPKDPIKWGLNPPVVTEEIPTGKPLESLRRNGTSVVLLTERKDGTGRLVPVDDKDAAPGRIPRKALIRNAGNYRGGNTGGPEYLPEEEDDPVPDYVLKDEQALKDDWARHNDILDGRLVDFRVMDRNGRVSAAHSLSAVTKDKISRLEPVQEIGTYAGYSDMAEDWGVRLGIRRTNLDLSSPELQEDGTIELGARARHSQSPQYYTVRIDPSEAEPKQGTWAGLHLLQGNQELFLSKQDQKLLTQSVERFMEQVSCGEEFTGKTGAELLPEFSARAVCPDFYSEKQKWQEIHEITSDEKRAKFAEQWLRSGHSLYNDYTSDMVVPDIDPKQGTVRGLYTMRLDHKDKSKIETIARKYEETMQRPLEDPCGAYVLMLRNPKNRNSIAYDRPEVIPAREIQAFAKQITEFPGAVRSGHGQTVQGLEEEDIRKINAHWGLDTLDRLHPHSDPYERIILPNQVDLHPENREPAGSGQLSLFYDDSYDEDARKEAAKDKRKEDRGQTGEEPDEAQLDDPGASDPKPKNRRRPRGPVH